MLIGWKGKLWWFTAIPSLFHTPVLLWERGRASFLLESVEDVYSFMNTTFFIWTMGGLLNDMVWTFTIWIYLYIEILLSFIDVCRYSYIRLVGWACCYEKVNNRSLSPPLSLSSHWHQTSINPLCFLSFVCFAARLMCLIALLIDQNMLFGG